VSLPHSNYYSARSHSCPLSPRSGRERGPDSRTCAVVLVERAHEKSPACGVAGRAICVRTPFRKIAVRRSLRDRRPPAPQAGGRNHESRAGRHEQDSCQCPASHVAMSKSRARRDNFGGCRRVTSRSNESPEQRHDEAVEKPSPSRPAGFPPLNESATRRSRPHAIGRRSVNQRPSGAEQVHIPSRSHAWVSIQVRDCKAFVTQIDCAPELTDRRELQAIGTKNLTHGKKSRAEFVRFLKVIRAGWHDAVSRITRAKLAGIRLRLKQVEAAISCRVGPATLWSRRPTIVTRDFIMVGRRSKRAGPTLQIFSPRTRTRSD